MGAGTSSSEAGPRELRYDSKWWGWGDAERHAELPARALSALQERLGVAPDTRAAVTALEDVSLSAAEPIPAAIGATVGEDFVLTRNEDRIRHAAGRGYTDLIRLRTGNLDGAPDAVVAPADASQLEAVIATCVAEGVALVPFGGGTSVVGGVAPLAGTHGRVISLDLCRMRDVSVDSRSMTAQLGPGLRGPEAEAALAEHGLTLGHYPQSYELATIGGYAATRSAGQASSGIGRFDELVAAVSMATPAGRLSTLETPHTAAGPSVRELVLGSEGVLGVIDEVTVRVRTIPEQRRHEGWITAGFESGCEIIRELAQRDRLPDIVRVSDEHETWAAMLQAGEGAGRAALDRYLRVRKRSEGALIICGWEDERGAVRARQRDATPLLRSGGGVRLGVAAGRAWERGRFAGPYQRDALLDAGIFVETLETSHTWTRLMELYGAVGNALRGALEAGGTPPIVLCHLSHAYRDGASLYFTFLARARPGEEIAQWASAKAAACEAIVATGGTITHHHAVGRDHAPYMQAEIGELGIDVLRDAKQRLDPAGIMNPGKLLP